MSNIYKVTAANIGETKRGYKVFNIQLNTSIFATQLVPLREIDRKFSQLYKLYTENNKSLEFLVGKYISIALNNTQYGIEFSSISSFDALQDFKKLLDASKGKAFFTRIQMYEFLKKNNYLINKDNSITLKSPYDYFNIASEDSATICYPNKLELNVLTLSNISAIYKRFYKDKCIDTGNRDRGCQYILTPVSIAEHCEIYHKSKSKTLSQHFTDVLKVGDMLSEEQLKFISDEQ